MLRHIKNFLNVQFKLEECEDEVYDDTSSEEENKDHEEDDEGGETEI